MFTTINHKGKTYKADLDKPIDISIPLRAGEQNVNAWNAAPVKIEPVRAGDWIGEVSMGGSVNFRNIAFNPHGNGTHTECVGHISRENYSINQVLKKFFLNLKIELIDFKIEFGRIQKSIILADEISPDTCRLWEVGTGNKLDKDRFRRDLGNIEQAYQEVLRRVSSQA